MRVLVYTPDYQWAGGIDLLHGFVKGLKEQKKSSCEIYLLILKSGTPVTLRSRVSKLKRVAISAFNEFKSPSKWGKLTNLNFFRKQNDAEYDYVNNIYDTFRHEAVKYVVINDLSETSKINVIKKIQPDIVFPLLANAFNKMSPVPWVGYIFDFIYKHHAGLFTKEFIDTVNKQYATTFNNTESVIVKSQSVHNDVYKFFPDVKARIFALPFAPYTNEVLYRQAQEDEKVTKRYNIGFKYFMISNQFWLHKSHETAFYALKILSEEGNKNIGIVCTGRMTDISGTDNRMNELKDIVRKLELENKIFFLGHIPKKDQLSLMLRAIAVIQPTLFEGGPGGGSVYMSVANGVPSIVSDIPVNKEIKSEPLVTFFEKGNSKDLAEKMSKSLLVARPILNYSYFKERNELGLEKLGEKLIECFQFTISQHQKQIASIVSLNESFSS